VTLKRVELAELKQQYSLLRVGGPGELKIGESDVVVTERNGRFYRVLGPGKQRLHKLEYVRTVLDLRQQERSQDQVSLVTQDGIEVRVDVSVIFRLRLRDDDSAEIPRPTPDTPYPYGEAAVRKAAYAEMVLDNGKMTTWEDRPLRAAIGALRQFVAETPLDMLIFPELTLAGGQTRRPHETLRKTAQARADTSLRKVGIQLLDVKLGRLETESQVTEQRIRYWQSYWDRQALLGAADGEASALREVALARAEAEAIMLRAIVEGLEDEDDQMRGDKTRQEVVALRLVGALERMATDEDTQILETDQILRRIQQLQQEIRRAPQLSRRPASEEQGET
jgi:regulator of protease activity HflC (stomatin/prohibitin superfamily)